MFPPTPWTQATLESLNVRLQTARSHRTLWNSTDLRRCILSDDLVRIYQYHRARRICLAITRRLEGDDFYSATLRDILMRYHGVQVGAYSYGTCMEPGAFPRGVVVGRYVSVASGVRVMNRNHPLGNLSTHPFFFNARLGWVAEDTVRYMPLEIGHDVWIGGNALITAGCSQIGIGAVVGAGSVVTKDVPDFAIVAGNPARVVRYRFSPKVCALVAKSAWWEHSVTECSQCLPDMLRPLDPWTHPFLRDISDKQAMTDVG